VVIGDSFFAERKKMNIGEDTLVLENDENYVRFSKLLAKAADEGRIDGKFRCQVCGMRYNNDADGSNCCAPVARSA
jgi:hypothetical protein